RHALTKAPNVLILAAVLVSAVASSESIVFSFNDTAPTEIYTLSLHDALPISGIHLNNNAGLDTYVSEFGRFVNQRPWLAAQGLTDRKSTRLNSSHVEISYAVFCLKKKKPK